MKTSHPSAWLSAMRAMQQDTSLNHFETTQKYSINILRTPFSFFETPLKQTVYKIRTLKNNLKTLSKPPWKLLETPLKVP